MNAINEVKMLAAKKGMTLTNLAKYMAEHSDKKYSLDLLSKKLRANTIRYSETQERRICLKFTKFRTDILHLF